MTIAGGSTPASAAMRAMSASVPFTTRCDGIDARSLNRAAARQQVAFVGRAEVFAGTLAENLRLGRDELSGPDLRRALDMVGLSQRVARLPEGIETELTPDGRPLSNNEISRLAVARALVGRPRLLLIDGMLDGLNLQECPELLDSLFDHTAGWTLVVVTVRDDLRNRCDRVLEWS